MRHCENCVEKLRGGLGEGKGFHRDCDCRPILASEALCVDGMEWGNGTG